MRTRTGRQPAPFGIGFGVLNGMAKKALSGPVPSFALTLLSGLSSAVAFSRGTNATMFDSQGRLVWAPMNLCSRSNNMTAGWSLSAEGTSTVLPGALPSGRDATRFETTVVSPTGLTSITAQAAVVGTAHALTVKVRYVNHPWIRIGFYSGSVSTNQVRMWFNLQTGAVGTVQTSGAASGATADTPIDLGGGWYQITIRGNVPFSAATDAGLLIATAIADASTTRAGAPASFDVGDALFEPVGAQTPQTFTAAHVTAGAAYYGPRFDYNPDTLAARGLLIEEQRTNLVPVSEFTGSSGGTNTAAPTPILGVSARRFTGDGAATTHFASGANTTQAGTTQHTISAILRYVDAQFVQLTTTTGAVLSTEYVNFDLVNGTVTAQGGSSTGRITRLSAGIYRCEMTYTTFAGTAAGACVIIGILANGTETRLPNTNTLTTSVDFIAAQQETAPFASSPIFTFGTAATRNVDAVSASTTGWYQSTGGTFVVVGTLPANATARTLCNLQGSGLNERNQLRMSAGNNFSTVIAVGGVVQTGSISFAGTAGRRKFAYQFSNGTQQLSVDGAAPGLGTSATIPTAVTSLVIGSLLTSGSEVLNGWIESLTYYPKTDFSSAQLQALSA